MPRAELRGEGETLVLSGVVDFDSVPDLAAQAGGLGGAGFSTVDAAGVTRIDSAGVAFLVWLRKHHAAAGAPLALRAAPAQLSRLLAVTGLDAVIG